MPTAGARRSSTGGAVNYHDPRMNPDNEQPGGATPESESARMEPFIASETLAALADKEAPLVLVQGHEEAARALLAVGVFPIGVETWSTVAIPIGSNGDSVESVRLHAAFDGIVFAKRKVYFHNSGDSDARAQLRLALLLAGRGAEVFEVVPKKSEPLAKSMENAPHFFTTLNVADIPTVREELRRTQPDGGIREALAKRLAKALDTTKDRLLKFGPEGAPEDREKARKVKVEAVEPWPDPVSLSDVLNETVKVYSKYIKMTASQAVVCAIWPVASFFHHLLQIHAYLAITAPSRRCGKTTLFNLVTLFSRCSLQVGASVSESFVFHYIDKYAPTLAVDEAQAAFTKNPGLTEIYNAGHIRDTAQVGRMDKGPGDAWVERLFNTFSPKILALKGRLHDDSLQDRVIEIRLSRMRRADKVEGDYWEDKSCGLDEQLLPLRRKLARAAIDLIPKIEGYRPKMPEFENSRARQNWRPLWIVAELAGGDWTERLEKAIAECEGEAFQELSFTDYLLTALEQFCDDYERRPDVLARKVHQCDFVPTDDILHQQHGLNADREAPWCTDDKHLTPEKLARELRQYGLRTSQEYIGENRHRCYSLKALREVFETYR